jgi:hypothetical protein
MAFWRSEAPDSDIHDAMQESAAHVSELFVETHQTSQKLSRSSKGN